jgi:acyl-coenzyme A synthetase/AMP-(fatty) acid ligase
MSAHKQWLPATPVNPQQDFVCNGASFAEVYAMAGRLHELFLQNRLETVCLATENKAVTGAALLAALAGKTTLLLPNALSKRALSRLQQATGFTALIGKPEECSRILPAGVTVLWPEKQKTTFPLPAFDFSADLLRLFTGGTTGAPSIWAKSGENMFSEACFLAENFAVSTADTIVATVSPCHIYGLLFAVMLPLVSGASVAGEIPSFPAEIAETVQQHQATVFAAVPAHYRAIRNKQIHDRTLRFAVSSAGMLDPEDNKTFCATNHVPVIEVYGSTETGGIATRNRFAGETFFTPFTTVDWKISGSRLAVRSTYISAQTSRDEDGYFLTGDRVQKEDENSFLLLGRADNIAKVAGKRVDLDEIREAIKQCAGIEDCVVLSLPDPRGRGNRICALVQCCRLNREELVTALQKHLEPYALPRVLHQVDTIPMTGAGKYDHGAICRLLSQ